MVDPKLEALPVGLPGADEGKEEVVVEQVPLEAVPPPTVGEFPDGGLAAWLVVVGVCAIHIDHVTCAPALTSAHNHAGRTRYLFYVSPGSPFPLSCHSLTRDVRSGYLVSWGVRNRWFWKGDSGR